MEETIRETPTLSKLYQALVKAQRNMKVATKDATNPFFKNKYADFEDVIKASRDALLDQGLSVLQRVSTENGVYYLYSRLFHESGEWIESKMQLIALKADMQGVGGAITYAKRYAYSALVGVVTSDEDDDGESAGKVTDKPTSAPIDTKPKMITKPQIAFLTGEINKLESQDVIDKIFETLQIEKLEDMKLADFNRTLKFVQEKIKEQKA